MAKKFWEIGEDVPLIPVDYKPGTVITNVTNKAFAPDIDPLAEVVFNNVTNPGYPSPGEWRKAKLDPNKTAGLFSSGGVIAHTNNSTSRFSNEVNAFAGLSPLFPSLTETNQYYPKEKQNFFLRYSLVRSGFRWPGSYVINSRGAGWIDDPIQPEINQYWSESGAYPTIWDEVHVPEYAGLWARCKLYYGMTRWRIVEFGNPSWHPVSEDILPEDPTRFIGSGKNKEGLVIHQGDIDPDTGHLDIPDFYTYNYQVNQFDPSNPTKGHGNLYPIPVGQKWNTYKEMQFSWDEYIYPHPPGETPSMWPAPLYKRSTDTFTWPILGLDGKFLFNIATNNIPETYGIDGIRFFRDFFQTPVPFSSIPALANNTFADVGP